jgi:hypothetical protein
MGHYSIARIGVLVRTMLLKVYIIGLAILELVVHWPKYAKLKEEG